MRIDPNSVLGGVPPEGSSGAANRRTGQAAASDATAPGSQPGPQEDGAVLSSSAQVAAALSAQFAATPEVRQNRVEALRQAINDGTYQVSPQQVAHSLFAELLAPSGDEA